MTQGSPGSPRFQRAGALVDGAFYLEREADRVIVEALLAGEPCHVLASRQVGKSSLKAHAVERLRARGRRVASADLSALGTEDVSEEAWSYSLCDALFESARSGLDLSSLWERSPGVTTSLRLDAALRALATEDPERPLVIFLDEIDLLIALKFRGNVLQVLRALLNDRAEERGLRGFALCLLGVALAVDVAPDINHSPFSGRPIELRDFTRDELRPLEAGLRGLGVSPSGLLDAVFGWTHGHPALTQHLCAELLAKDARDKGAEARVDALVRRVFLDAGRHQDQILVDIERRFAETNDRVPKMLDRYRAALAGEARDEGDDEVQEALRIAGLVRVEGGRLVTRNRVVATVFDRAWVDAKRADRRFARALATWLDAGRSRAALLRDERLRDALAWSRAQKELTEEERAFLAASQEGERAEAERATRQRRTVIALLVALVVGLAVALGFAVEGQRRATAEARRAREAQSRAEDLVTDEQMQRAVALAQQPDHPLEAVRLTIDAVLARRARGRPDREEAFEVEERVALHAPWLLLTLQGHSAPVLSAAFSPDGTRVVTGSRDHTARIYPATPDGVLRELCRPIMLVDAAVFPPDSVAHPWCRRLLGQPAAPSPVPSVSTSASPR